MSLRGGRGGGEGGLRSSPHELVEVRRPHSHQHCAAPRWHRRAPPPPSPAWPLPLSPTLQSTVSEA